MFLKIAVCDDNETELSDTRNKLEAAYKSLDLVIFTFDSGKKLIKSMKDTSYDLIILDIEMPETDGMTVAAEIRKSGLDTPVVFLTSHLEYALKGYEVNALRYLTKPVREEQLSEIINHLIARSSDTKKIILKNDYETLFVSVSDIIYMEAQNQDIRIVTQNGEYLQRYNIKDFENELKNYCFVRCHRSYIINISHAAGISRREVRMDNGHTVPLSRTREKSVKDALVSWNLRSAI